MSETATERLSRLLAMVPWLLAHQGVPLAAAAAEFGIDEDQLVKDLELLFVCGLPGHMPDDLIEAEWEDGVVFLANADAISRPLRLGVDEALALIVGLRALRDVPGLGDRDAVTRAPGQDRGGCRGGRGGRPVGAGRPASRCRPGRRRRLRGRPTAAPPPAPGLPRAASRRDHPP
jgi:proteasome accessory factor C